MATTSLRAFLGVGILCGLATGEPAAAAPPQGNDGVATYFTTAESVGEDGTHFPPGSTMARSIATRDPRNQYRDREGAANATGDPTFGSDPDARGALNIAIVASAAPDINAPFFTDPRDRLIASGNFATVAIINAAVFTPSVKELDAYDAVLVWSNVDFDDATVLGDNLSYYVNRGGGVVVAVFANSAAADARRLGGRWQTLGYEIVPSGSGTTTGPASLGTINVPAHPIVAGVSVFSGGSNSFRPLAAAFAGGGSIETVAEWDDGKTLVAVREDTVGSRIDLGFYPVSDAVVPGYWDQTTDGSLLLSNALLYAAERPALTPGDTDGDGDVDAADASAFSSCYTGENGGPVTAPCVTFDFDFDDDVDCLDWNAFTFAWTEPGDPPAFAKCFLATPVALNIACRYGEITPPDVADPIALLVTGGEATDPSVACVSAYVQSDATLGPIPVFQTWSGSTLYVTGGEIVPGTIYRVQADYGSPGAPVLSGASTLTTWRWGDTNDDGTVDLDDILCVLDGFAGSFDNCSRYAVDLLPDQPEVFVDLADILAVLDAFAGTPYPGQLPCK